MHRPTRPTLALLALSTVVFCGCATHQGSDPETASVPPPGGATTAAPAAPGEETSFEESRDYGDATTPAPANDPLEGLNRAIFGFNDVLTRYLLSPIAKVYTAIMPDPVETGIGNFFHNLGMPVRGVSALLQGKPERAGGEVRNFVVDSTVGLAGLMRPSARMFEPLAPEDLGQTLGAWGVGSGPYLVLPVLGPSTLRDTVARFGEWYLDPVRYVEDYEARLAFRLTDVVNELPDLTARYEQLKEASVDPYLAMRNVYLQLRQRAVEE